MTSLPLPLYEDLILNMENKISVLHFEMRIYTLESFGLI